MKPKNSLTRRRIFSLLAKNQDTLQKYRVKRIGLFGSYATGQQNQRSDIDFLVEFEKPTFDNFIHVIYDLEKLFRKKVEVLTPEGVESIRVKEVAEEIKRMDLPRFRGELSTWVFRV